jgi:hypothetical protein
VSQSQELLSLLLWHQTLSSSTAALHSQPPQHQQQ